MHWGDPRPPLPRRGDLRTLYPYAWFPRQLTTGEWVWLEQYERVQRWGEIPGTSDMFEGPDIGWATTCERHRSKAT